MPSRYPGDMRDPDAFLIAQFAKELVAIRLSSTEDPCAVAAALVKETAAVALKARPHEADVVIADACYGGLQALLLAGHDVSRGATLMLGEVLDLAGPLGGDPVALSEYALEGFARLRRLLTQEQIVDMLETLDSHFKGSGTTLARALARQYDPSRRQISA